MTRVSRATIDVVDRLEEAGETYHVVCQLMPNCPPYEYAGVSDLRAAFGWESLPHHRRYCQGGTERSGATAITITRLAVAGWTVAGGRAVRWHCLGSG